MSYRLSFDILILIHPYLSCNSPYQFVTLFSYEKKNNWSENKVIESIEHLEHSFVLFLLLERKVVLPMSLKFRNEICIMKLLAH